MPFFDLASLTKPLVTAPLALQHLDLDQDRREQLGFRDRIEPLTVRQLLSHSAGLPVWLPYTGEPLAMQLRRGLPQSAHPLFCQGRLGSSIYSDLGYRLLAELLEQKLSQPFANLGQRLTGLSPAPWGQCPVGIPDGPDAAAWILAEPSSTFPERAENLPHDANARAGMSGHAGFGATGDQMRAWLHNWLKAGFPARMAVETARAEDGAIWGLGLHRVFDGEGRFGQVLNQLPNGFSGVHVVEDSRFDSPPELSPLAPNSGSPTDFWMHLGYTGAALFVRPTDGFCLCLLLHRQGPEGQLLSMEALRARRWEVLRAFLAQI